LRWDSFQKFAEYALTVFLQGSNIADVSFGLSALHSVVAGRPETFGAISQSLFPASGWLLLSAMLGLALLGRQRIRPAGRRSFATA
jgi:hypothetical protein